MKYVPPIGAAAGAPYVDAAPASGIEGSPVPAAAIEHPMREIEAAIQHAGLEPSSGSLNQLALAIDAIVDARVAALSVPGIAQIIKTAAYTCVLGDAQKHLLHPSADNVARVFTIPANSAVAYPIGTTLTFVNQAGAGALSISITTDTMRMAGSGATGTRTLTANGIATALKITATEWIISGTGLS